MPTLAAVGLSPTLVALALAVLFAAALTKAMLGFGEGLLAMPLLTLLLGIRTSSPLVGLMSTGLTALMLVSNWRSVDVRSAGRLVVGTLVGIPLGVWGLRSLPEAWITAGLGVVLILAALYNLRAPGASEPGRTPGARWAYPFGFAGGILSGAYNTGGPPIVVYGTLERWPPDKFRATLQGCFLPAAALKLVGYGAAGLCTPAVLLLFALSVPVILAALWLGGRLSRRVPAGSFERLVNGGLAVLGVTLIVDSL